MIRERIGKQSEQNRKHRNHSLRRFFLYVVLVCVLYVGFGLLARIPGLQVSSGSFENIVVTDTVNIQNEIDIFLDERFLYPRRNVVWFSERKLERHIGDLFPRLDLVDVSLRSEKMIHVWANERQGEFLWCGDVPAPISVDTVCYFADSKGFVFDSAPFFAGATFVRLYSSLVEDPIGNQSVDPAIFDVLNQIQEILRPYNFNIQGLVEYEEGQYEFILNSKHSIVDAPRIRFVMGENSDMSLENLKVALSENNFLFEIRGQYDTLEYLDIRFSDQVVYKFKDPREIEITEEEVDNLEEEYVEENLEQTISEEVVSDDIEG